jgi:hypothetical protein
VPAGQLQQFLEAAPPARRLNLAQRFPVEQGEE